MSPSRPAPDFQEYQYAFARHLRDPKGAARPQGVPARRMRVYGELLFNNIGGFVSGCFPVARAVLGERCWKRLLREFFARHRCRTPFFRQIPEEFLQFIEARAPHGDTPDFLPHLLHYEWVELALDVSALDRDSVQYDVGGSLWERVPVLNPVHRLLHYPYAVHRIGRRYKPGPEDRQDTFILAVRDADDHVRFNVLNPVSARLVALLEQASMTGREAVERVVHDIRHPQPAVALAGGRALLEDLRNQDAILGTRLA